MNNEDGFEASGYPFTRLAISEARAHYETLPTSRFLGLIVHNRHDTGNECLYHASISLPLQCHSAYGPQEILYA